MNVHCTTEGSVLHLEIDRPDAGNRLDASTIDELIVQFETTRERGIRAVVLSGRGGDFSLGRQRSGNPSTAESMTLEFGRIQRLNEAVLHCSAVTIVGIRGRAEGAGLSLAARCDIVVVAENASLSFPEIPHGIPPTIVLSHFRYQLPKAILGDLIYTGRVLDGAEAVLHGLAARSVPDTSVMTVASGIATQVEGYDVRSIALVKEFLRQTEALPKPGAPELGITMYVTEMAERPAGN
jgi:enoyl-CoA hydratase/carnithine racemase